MRTLTYCLALCIAVLSVGYHFYQTREKPDTSWKHIDLSIGDIITTAYGDELYVIIDPPVGPKDDGRVCFKSLNGEIFITNFGIPGEPIVENSDSACSDEALFKMQIGEKGQIVIKK